jgi:hypothetical protein
MVQQGQVFQLTRCGPDRERVGFANLGGLVFVDESAEEIPTL